ncbi:protein FAM151A [Salminus brasiliensis]|uniref:protein FAM151A n=1 Tax=Salminus brasiliensis TaxID=930266 RepID=UPI003B8371AD
MEEKKNERQEERRKDEEEDEDEEKEAKTVLGVFTREQFTMLCVGVGLLVLLIVITVTSVLLTRNSGSGTSETMVPFPTDGDMLEFLVQTGEIREKDGLYATWYHAANSKTEMKEALQSGVMILEADVNVEGHNTVNETNIPIMAHPPNVYSDNTLKEWLEAVLESKRGIKLDFKSLQAVEPSLDLLRIKNQTGIHRPVWLNADILPGPNVPNFWPVVNATLFFDLIQRKFPDVTISPGWKVLYLSLFPKVTYTQAMVEQMYDTVKHLPQRITFPVLAIMAKNGWPHLSWLLSQSSRFSLTLWQGEENPTVNDLLFIRDNSNPQCIYYDIYEPVLSQLKEAAEQTYRPRRFYPGGNIIDYFKPADHDGLNILWETVTGRGSLLSILKDSPAGMLVIPVISGSSKPKIPVVEGSQPELPLQECLDLILSSPKPWGIYLRVKSPSQLANSLQLLRQAYDSDLLYHPTWLNMDVAHGAFNVHGYITGQEFLRTIYQNFPYVTIAPSWPQEVLREGYTPQLVEDMVELFQSTWQDVSLQLLADHLEGSEDVRGLSRPLQNKPRFSLTVEHKAGKEDLGGLRTLRLTSVSEGSNQWIFYNMPKSHKGII